jgi:hypothetical protein
MAPPLTGETQQMKCRNRRLVILFLLFVSFDNRFEIFNRSAVGTNAMIFVNIGDLDSAYCNFCTESNRNIGFNENC